MTLTNPLPLKVQAQLNGTWTDITRNDSYPTRLLAEQGVAITRGRANEQGRVGASTCKFTQFDPRGYFSNDNPRSPYYGVLPRNTPVRVYVRRPTVAYYVPGFGIKADGLTPLVAAVGTVDKTQLQVTGTNDLELRCDVEPFMWRRRGNGAGFILASKWFATPTANRSWFFGVDSNNRLIYGWSTDGSSNVALRAGSTIPLPISTGRLAVRVYHDVVNGTQSTVTFSYSTTGISGTYTTLGSPVNFATTTTIFNGTSPVYVGSGATTPGVLGGGMTCFTGRFYRFQMFNGGNGSSSTLVADANFAAQAVGTTSFTDGVAPAGNLWTLSGASDGAEITDADYRYYGELTNASQVPELSSQATNTEFECSGVLRRLQQNATPLRSPIYRNLSQYSPSGYWPLEDGSQTTQAGSAVTGSNPAQITDMTFTTDSSLPGSAGVMVCGSSGPLFTGIPVAAANTGQASLVAYFRLPSVPLSTQGLFTVYGNGVIARLVVSIGNLGFQVDGYAQDGSSLFSQSSTYGADPVANWFGINLRVKQTGGNAVTTLDWHVVGVGTQYTLGTFPTVAGSSGRFTKVVVQGVAALSGVKLSHIFLTQIDFPFFTAAFANYSKGYQGETALARFGRLLTENGINGYGIGASPYGGQDDSELMGPQSVDEIVNLLYEIVDVDGGELYEARDMLGLVYRSRTSMQNQSGLSLSYTVGKQLADVIKPTPDDSGIANDVTITRKNGASARASLESGPMSAAAPPNGIGRAPTSPTVNNYLDSRLPTLAQYALGIGTWPDARYPSVKVGLHRSPFAFYDSLFTLAARTDISEMVSVTDLPSFLPPDPLRFIVRGYTENLYAFLWNIEYNTTPAGPYRTNELTGVAGEEKRADASVTQLGAALTSTATSASFVTASGALCVTTASKPAEFPFDVMIAGERVTVTAITGTTSPQTATIVRSVNGIIKAQVSGAAVRLPADTAFYVTM